MPGAFESFDHNTGHHRVLDHLGSCARARPCRGSAGTAPSASCLSLISLGLRLALPTGGAVAGLLLCDEADPNEVQIGVSDCLAYGILGILAGALVASVTDAIWLANKEVPIMPMARLGPGEANLGFAIEF